MIEGGGERGTGPAEVVEVEAERLPHPGEAGTERSSFGGLVRSRLGPLTAGLIVDVVDLSTIGPPGLLIGAIAGWILAGQLRFPWRGRLIAAGACGVYCLFPPTNFLPLATLIGALAPVQPSESKPERG